MGDRAVSPESLLPKVQPYRIRVTWHYGNVREACEFEGPFLMDALVAAGEMFARYRMPLNEYATGAILNSLRRGEPNREWSWFTVERIA